MNTLQLSKPYIAYNYIESINVITAQVRSYQ